MGSKAEILQEISTAIRNNITDAAHSFVSTGYYLKQVRDKQLFLELGYRDIWEYASTEFGISKSNASRFMSINDKFSVDGNSTTLLEQYNNFSYSKLQEMLTLDEEQLTTITDDMTVKEIRNIKSKENEECKENINNSVDEDNEIDFDIDLNVKFEDEELPHQEDEDIKVCIHANDYLEDEVEDKDDPIATSQQKSDVEYAEGEVVTDTPVQQKKSQTIDDLDIPITAYNNLCRMGITTLDQLCSKTFDEINSPSMGRYYATKIEEALLNMDMHLKSSEENDCIDGCNGECTFCNNTSCNCYQVKRTNCLYNSSIGCSIYGAHDVAISLGINCISSCCKSCKEDCGARCNQSVNDNYKSDVEEQNIVVESNTVEQDSDEELIKKKIVLLTEKITALKHMGNPNMKKVLKASELELKAYKNLLTIFKEVAPVQQPELPLLKNNDQRKEFIDNYQSWPIWIDQELTGERYYRYDFDGGASIVVKVSTCHKWNSSIGFEPDVSYGREKYYLIGIENEEKYKPKISTFAESETNKSALIDYLKEYQKKG